MILENLQYRSALLKRIRRFFDDDGFLEVQTPVLSADTVVDRYLEPLTVQQEQRVLYFRTSPEFSLKRLLASHSGELRAVYEIGSVFRQGDRGTFHNPEFTMLEWYRVGDDYQAGRTLLAELTQTLTQRTPPQMLTFQEAFEEKTGLNPHQTTPVQCKKAAEQNGIIYPESFIKAEDTELWVDLLFAELVQKELKSVILYDYPVFQSLLAKTRYENGYSVSERFELFLNGIEIANGYHELLDADELERRFIETNRLRLADNKQALPVKSRLLTAMRSGLPPCSGTALGIDRLMMVLTGAGSLDDVIVFPWEIA